MICISRRYGRISPHDRLLMLRPSNSSVPSEGSSSLTTTRPVVDFPQPDSPTSPSVSPDATWKETPSTAFTAPILRWNRMPRVIGKCFLRLVTLSSASPPPVSGAWPISAAGLVVVKGPSSRHEDVVQNVLRLGLVRALV